MDKTDIQNIQKTVFSVVNFQYDGEIKYVEKDCVYCAVNGDGAFIGAPDKAGLARACFLLAKQLSEGKTAFEICQHRRFETLGYMVDCSRNAVLTVDGAKKLINSLAALGYNMLMLYTEDTYELKDYPFFGYMRGRYSHSELREIDEYAYSMGIEVIPCIQTLAHLSQFLKWNEPDGIKDTDDILLIDEPKTYDFIRAQIAECRSAFKSNRIHIGMDEAHAVGLGKYLELHGFTDRFELLCRHLNRVVDICGENGFAPMMWSDMFFRLLNKGGYEGELPDELRDKIPRVDMVYWDYYNNDSSHYISMIDMHKKLGNEIVFAGGVSSWMGFLAWFEYGMDNSYAAAQAMLDTGLKTVFTTFWGDDGNEADIDYFYPQLAVYSSACYNGTVSKELVASEVEFLTKISYEDYRNMGKLNPWYDRRFYGKELFYSDVLYDIGKQGDIVAQTMNEYTQAMARLEGKQGELYDFARLVYKICICKGELRLRLRKAYRDGDLKWLEYAANELLPTLKDDYGAMKALHKKMWMSHYKPFGFETLSFRYGGIISRLDDAMQIIAQYLDGKVARIEELEQTALNKPMYHHSRLFTLPSVIQ